MEREMAIKISSEERKDFIAKIAAKVFSKKGYQGASLQDIALKTKISKAGIYHYFKSKDEILAYILIKYNDDCIMELKNDIKDSNEKSLSPQDSLKKLIGAYARLVNSDKVNRLIVLRERHQLTGNHKKELVKKERAIFHVMKDELNKIDNLGKNTNHNIITFLFISMSHWLGYWYKEEKGMGLEAIIDHNIQIIFHGILEK